MNVLQDMQEMQHKVLTHVYQQNQLSKETVKSAIQEAFTGVVMVTANVKPMLLDQHAISAAMEPLDLVLTIKRDAMSVSAQVHHNHVAPQDFIAKNFQLQSLTMSTVSF
jgi:hypothetical protein